MEKFLENLKNNHLDVDGNPINEEGKLLLGLALSSGTDHVKEGYKGNDGRDRATRKDGSFDYLKMSKLYHSGDW